MKKYLVLLFVLVASGFTGAVQAQKWAVKSNLLYDATTSMNLGVEFGLAEKWTFDLSGNYNPWTFSDNKKWKHWFVQPEVRYWTCKRFGGHFLAAHIWGGEYNVGNVGGIPDFLGTKFSNLKDYRYEGWFAGAGIAPRSASGTHIRVMTSICVRDADRRSAAATTTISAPPRRR